MIEQAMIEKCTFSECDQEAVHPLTQLDGKVWARLCEAHHEELLRLLKEEDAPGLIRFWVRSHGTKDRWIARMMGRENTSL
jgi:hypothetical protein